MPQQEIILITVTGADRPGLTSNITAILGQYGATILDIGQANFHHQLTLGIMFLLRDATHSGDMMKQLLFTCTSMNLQIRFTPVSEDEGHNTVWELEITPSYTDKNKYIHII